MKKKHTPLTNDEVRIIKISEEALYEFIYEKFIDDQDTYLDVDNLAVTDSFYMDWENRQFIFCAYKTENENGELLEFHERIDIEKLINKIPDTTESMYSNNRYKKFTTIVWEEMGNDDSIRYLNQTELERCQTVPEGYTKCLTRNEAADVLGDGFTVDVIAHIFSFINTQQNDLREVM